MASPTSARHLTPIGPRPFLDRGLRYEQAGLADRAIAAYESAVTASVTPVERAEAHIRLARVERTLSNWDNAIREANEAARLAASVGNDDLVAEAMNVEVGVHQLRGDFNAGERIALTALDRARDPRVRGMLLQNLGSISAQRREYRSAERLFSQSVEAFKAARYEVGMALALNNASAAARDAGDYERALELAVLAREVAERIDALDIIMLALQNQAHALLEHGSIGRAESIIGEVLGHNTAARNILRQAECLEIMGRINEWKSGCLEVAVRCYELAADKAERVGDRMLLERLERRLKGLMDVATTTPARGWRTPE